MGGNKYQKKWNQIAKSTHPAATVVQNPAPEESKETFTFPADVKYLLYNKMPICLLNGVLYAMYPIDDPSLGYKLIMANYDKKIVLLNPHYISERQAVGLLFSS